MFGRRSTDGGAPRSKLDRLKDFWWVFGIICFLAGGSATAFAKFTVYYLAEQNSVTTLQNLNASSILILARLQIIDTTLANMDKTLTEQKFVNNAVAGALHDFADHVHALDGRADTDRNDIADLREKLGTQAGRLMWLLDPKVTTRK